MIRAKFQHSRKGIVFKTDDVITNLTSQQEEEAIKKGWAYVQEEAEEKVTISNSKKEIQDYMYKHHFGYDESMTKAELIEIIENYAD